jgi:hypothetical protein
MEIQESIAIIFADAVDIYCREHISVLFHTPEDQLAIEMHFLIHF